MKTVNTKKMATSALFAAMICVATMIVITYAPSGGGYVHLGDCLVLLAGWILGPLWGGAAAAVGSALTDLILSAPQYIPATFVIKGLVAAIAWLVMKLMVKSGNGTKILFRVLSAVSGEAVMIAGYFLYEILLYGAGGAAANIMFNVIQAASGVVLASLLIHPLMKISYLRELGND